MPDIPATSSASGLQDLQKPLREMHQQFQTEIEPIRPDLFAYCLRLTGSVFDAEDLVQETLTRAFGRLCQYFQPVEPRPYMFRMASNLWIDQCRRAKRVAFEPLDLDHPSVSDDPDLAEDVREALLAVVDLLEPRQRVAVLLKDVFGFSTQEIAEFLETTPGAVKALLHRGRSRIEHTRDATHPIDSATIRLANAYADRLSAQDWDGIAALLRADATVSIIGVDEELGRDWIRSTSLADAAKEPLPGNRAEVVMLDGEPIILWLFQPDDGPEAIRDVLRFASDGKSLTHVWLYWFCPDTIRAIGNQLGRRAEPDGAYAV